MSKFTPYLKVSTEPSNPRSNFTVLFTDKNDDNQHYETRPLTEANRDSLIAALNRFLDSAKPEMDSHTFTVNVTPYR